MRIIIFSLLISCALRVVAQDMQIRISAEQIDNLAIKVGALQPSQHLSVFYAPARVTVPVNRELLLTASQPGLLTQLQANLGDRVKKGQILAQMHSPELVALQQQYLTARSHLHLASLEQKRDKTLYAEGVISERRQQETQAMYASKAAIADEAKQLLLMAGMTPGEIDILAKTHKLNSLLNLRSPISGVVLERKVTLGSRLAIQEALYRIGDLSELWLEINIPQERMASVQIGDWVQDETGNVRAKITLLGQSVNRENQTVLARAVIEGETDHLRVGQNLNVQIMQAGLQSGFKVPNSAIAQNAGKAYVFVRNPGGFAVTEVQVLGRQDAESLISGPLTGQEQIAVQGAVALKANWLGMGGDE
ncbi:efflux RND transporter periplasmic adaptor subunit [Methylomonas methanica]|uniref:Efflux transporter, RND family, MFP subunit n=1 Tax=Methylomonas methanica (strain DSM 25384 / MC09) TaxID=857087 RepID=F9ZYU3_METMM|nr:efflux RND transporter periplasmic adaptor subunit [Methylomonas methanica]AEF98639.1 efflux transporter, RND family, MFP subunit [Methylomonas methanica MC09]